MARLLRKPERSDRAPGKLKEAARAWALARLGRVDDRQPVEIDADVIAQFSAMGAQAVPTTRHPDSASQEDFAVFPSNWSSVSAFIACETQWRAVATMAGMLWLGLDYSCVDVVMRRLKADDQVFADIQIMEQVALSVFGENRP